MRRACIKDGLQDWLMSVKFNHIKSFKVINESITTKYAFKVRKMVTREESPYMYQGCILRLWLGLGNFNHIKSI